MHDASCALLSLRPAFLAACFARARAQDDPVVQKLRSIDDEYLKLQREYDDELAALQLKCAERGTVSFCRVS